MARNRMLNPDFWLDEEIAKISPLARLLYQGLWGICDDNNATLPNRPEWIKAQVFPYESVNTPQLLGELSGIGKVILFSHENKEYWYIKNFFKHQRVEKPSKEKYPPFIEANSISSRGGVGEELGSPPAEDKIREEKLSKENILADKQQANTEIKKYERKLIDQQTQLHRICYYLEDTLSTKIVNWGKQAKALAMILRAGYTEKQILFSIKTMSQEEFYQDKGFDLMTVANSIAQLKAKVRGAVK